MITQETIKALKSTPMKPFWEAFDRIYESVYGDLRKTRDTGFCRALDALDRVKKIPDDLARTLAQSGKQEEG